MQWKGRVAYLATMHRKEQVIGPLLAEHLGIQVQVVAFDTDQLGTFSRERPRPGDPIHTLRLKIARALQDHPEALGLASEGSFGPHPQIPWIPSNQEWVMLRVFEPGAEPLELVGYAESTQTNFSHRWVQSWAEALDFAQRAGFPQHALIALDQPEKPQVIHKGIQDEATLKQVVGELLARQGGLHLETDMRALYNPTRLQVIAAATQNLIAKAQSLCPACGTPGYWQIRSVSGLPCGQCGAPNPVAKAWVYGCARCSHTHTEPVAEPWADPAQCAFCNP